MKMFTLLFTLTILALTSCAETDFQDYNETGSLGSLVKQDVGIDGNVCRYDNGQTVFTQGNCPASVRNSVYTRIQGQ